MRIMEAVCAHDAYFVQKRNSTSSLGLSLLQKCTTAMHMFAYEVPANAIDETCRIGESMAMESMKRFCRSVRACFESSYILEKAYMSRHY